MLESVVVWSCACGTGDIVSIGTVVLPLSLVDPKHSEYIVYSGFLLFDISIGWLFNQFIHELSGGFRNELWIQPINEFLKLTHDTNWKIPNAFGSVKYSKCTTHIGQLLSLRFFTSYSICIAHIWNRMVTCFSFRFPKWAQYYKHTISQSHSCFDNKLH